LAAAIIGLGTALIAFKAASSAGEAAAEANRIAEKLNKIADDTKTTIQTLGTQAVECSKTSNLLGAAANRLSDEMRKLVTQQVDEAKKFTILFDQMVDVLKDYRLTLLHNEFRQALDNAERSWPCGCTNCQAESDLFHLKGQLERACQLERQVRSRLSAMDYLKFNLLGSVVWNGPRQVEYCGNGFDAAKESGESYELSLALMLLGHAEFVEAFEIAKARTKDLPKRDSLLSLARAHYQEALRTQQFPAIKKARENGGDCGGVFVNPGGGQTIST
jgi:hypothetical protein